MGLVNLCEDAHASLIVHFLTHLRNEIVAAVQTVFSVVHPKLRMPCLFQSSTSSALPWAMALRASAMGEPTSFFLIVHPYRWTGYYRKFASTTVLELLDST